VQRVERYLDRASRDRPVGHLPARSPAGSGGRLGLMARVLLSIWVAGTTTYTVGLLLKPPPQGNDATMWRVSIAAAVFTAALWVGRRRLPGWAPDASGVMCFFLASVVVVASHDPATPSPLFYLWVIVTSCYFVPPVRAGVQVVSVAVSYGIALALCDPPFPLDRWALLSLTAVAVGWTVATLRARELSLVEQLDRAARTDGLTGLLNRRAFDEALAVELERARRTGAPMSLIIADLDRFKAVNDHFGHTAGDAVLRAASDSIAESIRRIDVSARVGGEEFAVICPGCTPADAVGLAERIRNRISESLGGVEIRVTISLGVATYPDHAPDAGALFDQADSACYRAKRLGRNRTVAAERQDKGSSSFALNHGSQGQ
jgi:diguanylate cyclase (GGDEF)-like protein